MQLIKIISFLFNFGSSFIYNVLVIPRNYLIRRQNANVNIPSALSFPTPRPPEVVNTEDSWDNGEVEWDFNQTLNIQSNETKHNNRFWCCNIF